MKYSLEEDGMQADKARPGRPRRQPAPAERVGLSLRVTPRVKLALEAEAEAAGRSLSQEAEIRLEYSFDRQQLFDQVLDLTYGDPHLVALLMTMGEAMRDTLTMIKAEPGWIDDPIAFGQITEAACNVIGAYRPAGSAASEGASGSAMARFTILRLLQGSPRPWVTWVRRRIDAALIDRLRERQEN
jgi:hypothetical protein